MNNNVNAYEKCDKVIVHLAKLETI